MHRLSRERDASCSCIMRRCSTRDIHERRRQWDSAARNASASGEGRAALLASACRGDRLASRYRNVPLREAGSLRCARLDPKYSAGGTTSTYGRLLTAPTLARLIGRPSNFPYPSWATSASVTDMMSPDSIWPSSYFSAAILNILLRCLSRAFLWSAPPLDGSRR